MTLNKRVKCLPGAVQTTLEISLSDFQLTDYHVTRGSAKSTDFAYKSMLYLSVWKCQYVEVITSDAEIKIHLLQSYIGNYTSEWDLVGSRFRNELPLSPWDAMRYGWEACEALLKDNFSMSEVQRPEGNPRAHWDVVVIDGAYPECLLGVLHDQQLPTIMLNTVSASEMVISIL